MESWNLWAQQTTDNARRPSFMERGRGKGLYRKFATSFLLGIMARYEAAPPSPSPEERESSIFPVGKGWVEALTAHMWFPDTIVL